MRTTHCLPVPFTFTHACLLSVILSIYLLILRTISQWLDINSQVNVSSFLSTSSFNLNSTQIIPSSTISTLNTFNNTGLLTYNISYFISLLEKNVTSVNMTAVALGADTLLTSLYRFNVRMNSWVLCLANILCMTVRGSMYRRLGILNYGV